MALCSTAVCLPFGVALSWLLERRNFAGKVWIDALVQLPMVLPPVVPGYLLLLLLGTQGPIGGWLQETFGIVVAFTWKGAVLASAVMAFPLMVQPIRLAFRLIDPRLEKAAMTLGRAALARLLHRDVAACRCRASSPDACCASRAVLASSARPWPSSATFPAKPARCRWRSTALRTCPMAMRLRCGLSLLSIALAVAALLLSHWISLRAERKLGYLDHRSQHAEL